MEKYWNTSSTGYPGTWYCSMPVSYIIKKNK